MAHQSLIFRIFYSILGNYIEKISPETLFTRHVLGRGHVSLCPFAAIVSGVEDYRKTIAIRKFLTEVVKMTDESKEWSCFDKPKPHCLSRHEIMVLGSFPYEDITWLMIPTECDNAAAVMCLVSYFAKLCSNRQNINPGIVDYHKLIEFAPIPATSENIDLHSTEISDHIRKLYPDLLYHWERLDTDENFRKVVPTGVCLINLFDIGPCEAAQDLLPFINKINTANDLSALLAITVKNTEMF